MKLKIEKLANDGEGIAYLNKKPVYIYYTLPGETVDCEIIKNKRNTLEGINPIILTENKDRVKFNCPHYMQCGGCSLMHLDYFKSLDYKVSKTKHLLKGINCEIKNIKRSLNIFSYRNKTDMPVRKIGKNIATGLFYRGTNQIFNFKKCLIQSNNLNYLISNIINDLKKTNITVYNQKDKTGDFYAISLRENSKKEYQLAFILLNDNKEINKFADYIFNKYNNIKSVYKIIKKSYKEREILNGELIYLKGDYYLKEYYNNNFIYLLPQSFMQLNYLQSLNLYSYVVEIGEFNKGDIVLDAYSGVSTISFNIYNLVDKVISMEIDNSSYICSLNSIKDNEIKNIIPIKCDISNIEKFVNNYHFNKVIVDPPRFGLDKNMINYLLKNSFDKIIYISCDLKTLKNDLNILSKKYKVISLKPFDMFPMTSHVETVALLTMK